MHLTRLRALATLLSLTAVLWGCSSGDKSTGTGGDPDDVTLPYLLEGYFSGTVVEGGFGIWVGRLDPQFPSSRECQITMNGEALTLLPGVSDDDDALFALVNHEYEPNVQYTISASLGGRTSTCSFMGPEYPWIDITTPSGDGYFTPGAPVELVWAYDRGTPQQIYVRVTADGGEEDIALVEQELAGATTSYTVAGLLTAAWSPYDQVLVTVDGGEDAWPFTGDLAVASSAVYTVCSGDAAELVQGEEPVVTWQVTVVLDDAALDADGVSTTPVRARVEDEGLAACPDGTPVTFRAEPSGYVTLDPTVATTAGGEATTLLTAGTSAPAGGVVTVYAAALEAEGSAGLTMNETSQVTVGPGATPTIDWTPAEPMVALFVRQSGLVIGNLRWSITGYFSGPVTYGTTPGSAVQTYPLLGQGPVALVTGTAYSIVLVDAAADTTTYEFVR